MAKKTSNQVGLKYGFRSGLEKKIQEQLNGQRVDYTYEELTLNYVKPSRESKYTPDFVLPNGIIIESKGRFVTADRQKHLLIKEQHPRLDIRFVFSNPKGRISKQSKTTYGMWCEKHGFQYTKLLIPQKWIDEPKCLVKVKLNKEVNIKK